MPDLFSFGPHNKPPRLAGLARLSSRFCRRAQIQLGDLLKVRDGPASYAPSPPPPRVVMT